MNAGDWFGQEGAGFMRMNLACPRQTLDRALDRIAEALAKERAWIFGKGLASRRHIRYNVIESRRQDRLEI